MRRTQLYLDDQLWAALHIQADAEKTTISELVRRAVRDRYLGNLNQRRLAMERLVGSRTSRGNRTDSTQEVRELRRGAPGQTGRSLTILVDSDILIEVSRASDRAVVLRWMDLSASDALILFSPVTLAELWARARPTEYALLEGLFEVIQCVPVSPLIGRQAGEFLRKYRKGHAVELADALIAASAIAAGALPWTRNRKPYSMPEIRFFK